MHFVARAGRRTPFLRLAISATTRSFTAKRAAQKRSPHAILGIAIGADKEDIKRAFLKRAQETHPDKPDGDKEEFRRVQEAFEALRDSKDGKSPVHRATAARANFASGVRDIRDGIKGQMLSATQRAALGAACADARGNWKELIAAAEASPTDAKGRLDGDAASLVLDLCVLTAQSEGKNHSEGLKRARTLLNGLRPALFAAHRDREQAYNALLRLSAADGLGSDCTSFAMDVVAEMEKQKLTPDLGLLTQVIFPRFGAGASGY